MEVYVVKVLGCEQQVDEDQYCVVEEVVEVEQVYGVQYYEYQGLVWMQCVGVEELCVVQQGEQVYVDDEQVDYELVELMVEYGGFLNEGVFSILDWCWECSCFLVNEWLVLMNGGIFKMI